MLRDHLDYNFGRRLMEGLKKRLREFCQSQHGLQSVNLDQKRKKLMTWSMKRKCRLTEWEHSIENEFSMGNAHLPQLHLLLFPNKLCDQVPLITALADSKYWWEKVRMRYPHPLSENFWQWQYLPP